MVVKKMAKATKLFEELSAIMDSGVYKANKNLFVSRLLDVITENSPMFTKSKIASDAAEIIKIYNKHKCIELFINTLRVYLCSPILDIGTSGFNQCILPFVYYLFWSTTPDEEFIASQISNMDWKDFPMIKRWFVINSHVHNASIATCLEHIDKAYKNHESNAVKVSAITTEPEPREHTLDDMINKLKEYELKVRELTDERDKLKSDLQREYDKKLAMCSGYHQIIDSLLH